MSGNLPPPSPPPVILVSSCVTDNKRSSMRTLVVGARRSHRKLGLPEKSCYLVSGKVISHDLNFRGKKISTNTTTQGRGKDLGGKWIFPWTVWKYQITFILFLWLVQREYMYLPNPSVTNRKWHRVIFKRSITCLNSEFSFSLAGCHSKVKEHCLPCYLLMAGGY